MPKFLAIETTGKICSVALFNEEKIIDQLSSNQENKHSAVLHQLIQELIANNSLSIKDLEAIALSKGPGSYTGLRIGSSSAKGLCVALGIPLVAIPSHKTMLYATAVSNVKSNYNQVVCLTDARRDDVFISIYTKNRALQFGVQVKDLTNQEVQEQINAQPSLIIGSGAKKAREFLTEKHTFVEDDCLSAYQLQIPFVDSFKKAMFENIVDFEPAYEKEFYTVPSKKKAL